MMVTAFASWVEPIATRLRENRAQVIAFARSAPRGIWDRPSPVAGWTNKDILAHLAGGNDRMVQDVLSAVIAGEPVGPALLEPDTDGANARGVEERRAKSVPELIDELERDGEELQSLLFRLREEHRNVRPGGAPWTIEAFLRVVQHESHDLEHLRQLQAAVERA